VLELGAGRSTPWLARRAGSVLSLEDNPYWHDHAAERLREAQLARVALVERVPALGIEERVRQVHPDGVVVVGLRRDVDVVVMVEEVELDVVEDA
jgi:protein-L-isoaspartate O-methyltransferase